jgi:hypothetical protein
MDINHTLTPAVSGIRRVPRFPGQLDFVHLGAPRLVATYNPCLLAMADVAHVVHSPCGALTKLDCNILSTVVYARTISKSKKHLSVFFLNKPEYIAGATF